MLRREYHQHGVEFNGPIKGANLNPLQPHITWDGPALGPIEERRFEVSQRDCHASLVWCLDCLMHGKGWAKTIRSGCSRDDPETMVGY